MKDNQIILVVVLLLASVIALLVYDRTQEPQNPAEAIGNAIEQVQDDMAEVTEEIQDEIDDHTTTRQ